MARLWRTFPAKNGGREPFLINPRIPRRQRRVGFRGTRTPRQFRKWKARVTRPLIAGPSYPHPRRKRKRRNDPLTILGLGNPRRRRRKAVSTMATRTRNPRPNPRRRRHRNSRRVVIVNRVRYRTRRRHRRNPVRNHYPHRNYRRRYRRNPVASDRISVFKPMTWAGPAAVAALGGGVTVIAPSLVTPGASAMQAYLIQAIVGLGGTFVLPMMGFRGSYGIAWLGGSAAVLFGDMVGRYMKDALGLSYYPYNRGLGDAYYPPRLSCYPAQPTNWSEASQQPYTLTRQDRDPAMMAVPELPFDYFER